MVFCLCHMCECRLHKVHWLHISILLCLLAAEPRSIAGLGCSLASSFLHLEHTLWPAVRFHSGFLSNKFLVLTSISLLIFFLCTLNGSQQTSESIKKIKSLFIYKFRQIFCKFTSLVLNPKNSYIRHVELLCRNVEHLFHHCS